MLMLHNSRSGGGGGRSKSRHPFKARTVPLATILIAVFLLSGSHIVDSLAVIDEQKSADISHRHPSFPQLLETRDSNLHEQGDEPNRVHHHRKHRLHTSSDNREETDGEIFNGAKISNDREIFTASTLPYLRQGKTLHQKQRQQGSHSLEESQKTNSNRGKLRERSGSRSQQQDIRTELAINAEASFADEASRRDHAARAIERTQRGMGVADHVPVEIRVRITHYDCATSEVAVEYEHRGHKLHAIQIGIENHFDPAPIDRGQPSIFPAQTRREFRFVLTESARWWLFNNGTYGEHFFDLSRLRSECVVSASLHAGNAASAHKQEPTSILSETTRTAESALPQSKHERRDNGNNGGAHDQSLRSHARPLILVPQSKTPESLSLVKNAGTSRASDSPFSSELLARRRDEEEEEEEDEKYAQERKDFVEKNSIPSTRSDAIYANEKGLSYNYDDGKANWNFDESAHAHGKKRARFDDRDFGDREDHFSGWAILGIVVLGLIIILIIAAALAYCFSPQVNPTDTVVVPGNAVVLSPVVKNANSKRSLSQKQRDAEVQNYLNRNPDEEFIVPPNESVEIVGEGRIDAKLGSKPNKNGKKAVQTSNPSTKKHLFLPPPGSEDSRHQ